MEFKRVYIEITNICNLTCSFCPPCPRKPASMSVPDFKKVATMVAQHTKYIFLHIKGEPLLHPHLGEILEISHQLNLNVNLTTNGTLIQKQAEVLLNSPALRQLNISVHGYTPETHGNLDSWISLLVDFSHRAKDRSIYTVFRFWTDNNLDYNHTAITLLENHFKTQLKKDTRTTLTDKIYASFDSEFIWPSISNELIGSTGTCYGTRTMLGVLVDGSVVPCCLDNNGDCTLGNIFKTSLAEIITSPQFTDMSTGFKNRKVTHNLCKRCGYRLRFNK